MSATYSLRRRLVGLLTVALGVIWLLAALAAYQRTHHEADELLDTQLVQLAETLLAIMEGGEVEHFVKELQKNAHAYPVPIAFEIWHTERGRTRRLVNSEGHTGFDTQIPTGFGMIPHRGQSWRIYAVQGEGADYQVVVGQAHAARESLAREIGLSVLAPGALALPLMALAVWWGVGRSLRPVDAAARQVAALDPQHLAPLDEGAPLPSEIAPLRSALNTLVGRVNEAFESERRFTADAAHELRTPLAALKVQAQVASRAQSDETRQRALAQVIAGVDRMTHLVEQLLTLARVDPANAPAAVAPVDPADVVAAVCAELLQQARQQGQTLEADLAGVCRVSVNPGWLQIAVRNLVDNALRYAGADARIEVRVAAQDEGCVLTVADDGPGVPPGERERLAARFVRGESGSEGCGLGLSIVARIAALSHARLELGDGLPRSGGGHGFAATLRLPVSTESQRL
ncbi:MAG: ATP-binding protein [Gammaproteobacteria bacterium]